MKNIILIVVLVLSTTVASTTIYKWIDDIGRTQFSDKPPPDGKAESLTVEDHRSRSFAGRVIDGEYITYDGTIRIKVPQIIQPGAKIESRQITPQKSGLFMVDDFGNLFSILITVKIKSKMNMDNIIQTFQPRYQLINRQVITGKRGKELRLISLRKGFGLITSLTIKGGKRSAKQSLNLIDATTIFLLGEHKDIIEVTAGVTELPLRSDRSQQERQEHLSDLAQERLDEFLAGIVIE